MTTPAPYINAAVLFYGQSRIGVNDPQQPFAAKVIYVHSRDMVNLMVWDHADAMHIKSSVRLRAPDQGTDRHGNGENFATWSQHQMREHARNYPPGEFSSDAAA